MKNKLSTVKMLSFRAKKAEMKDDGRHSRDLVDQYAFLMFRDSTIMARVIKQGLLARPMPFNALGKQIHCRMVVFTKQKEFLMLALLLQIR